MTFSSNMTDVLEIVDIKLKSEKINIVPLIMGV